MTQDATITIKEMGAWLTVNVGTAEAPKLLRLKMIPADFEQLNAINKKIVQAGKAQSGKDATVDPDRFGKEVVSAVAPFVVDWNLHDENGKIECSDENKIRQLGRFMTAFIAEEPKKTDADDEDKNESVGRQTVLTKIMAFVGDYSNFMEA